MREIPAAYLTVEEAAAHVGKSLRTLSRWVEKYQIPRKGPYRNQFSKADLDAFMDNPDVFLAAKVHMPRHRGGSFTRVTA
ncbi:MAG: helix-turn-helix domain-containing protein [Humidesulfovibrio sp.]|jgi:excisionase family DNA binding protein|uniref:helix-turn-helix domain-containing protein n=1 Tax=Humidesulfovibrio sp. TaxID=2910988 RepID=UPI002732E4C6|nr:helix-turn-helix domain-containing protein [Humidesulfovibrio sp.]MDP2848281.1 helix-turn-helix domain-containing protein [Humidesulfovibrio sp.]